MQQALNIPTPNKIKSQGRNDHASGLVRILVTYRVILLNCLRKHYHKSHHWTDYEEVMT